MLTRRGFLGAVGAGALAAACSTEDGKGKVGGFELGIQSWSFRAFSLEDALAMMNQLGLTRIELSPCDRLPGHLHFPEPVEATDAMHAMIRDAGIDCVTSHIPLPLDGVNPEINRAAFEYAKRIGLHAILIDPPYEALDDLEALAVEFDIRVAIHNHTYSPRYVLPEHVLAVMEGRDKRIGALCDTGHYTRAGVDPLEAMRMFGDRLYGVHLKDVAGVSMAAPDAILGEGILDLPGLFQTLRDVSFRSDASLSIEYETNEYMPLDDLAVAIANLRTAAAS
ncbi:hypothetical protein BH11MYX3_BH11MYX3_32300 [soil metagenome]